MRNGFGGTTETGPTLGRSEIEEIRLLEELGIVDSGDFEFGFTVEGFLNSESIHISAKSCKRVFSSVGEIAPEYHQPNLVKFDTPASATDYDRPMIHGWIKRVVFDAWRITSIGRDLFAICSRPKDPEHFLAVKQFVLKSGIKLRP